MNVRIPELEVEQAPEAIAAVGACRRRDRASSCCDGRRIDDAALARAPIEQHVARDGVPAAAHPARRTARESPSSAACRIDRGQQRPSSASRSTRLVVQPESFHASGRRRGELHELVIEERHAALDRGRHAHLVLLHQQLDQVGLDVGVEQPVEQRAAVRRARSKYASDARVGRGPR